MGCCNHRVFYSFWFLADLKTIYPTIYDKPLQTVNSILAVLHKDSLVSSKEQYLLSEGDPLENEEEDTGTMPTNPGAVTQAEVCDWSSCH